MLEPLVASGPAPVLPSASPHRLRVLQVGKFYPPHMGGMETHLRDLCAQLAEGLDVRVLVANEGRRTTREVMDGVEVIRLGRLATLRATSFCPGMPAAIRGAAADLVHLHLPNPAAALAYLASGHRGKLVVTYHSDVIRQRILGAAFKPVLRRLLDAADAIIVATPNHVTYSDVLPEFAERCHVIPFGIAEEKYARPDAEAVARIRRGFGSPIVLGVGRLVYYKGFEYLVDAMREVNGHLLLAGTGPLRGQLQAQAQRQGLADRVTFLGQVPDLVPYYTAADVFVLPSVARSEAFGLVQLEAMACGTPVINTALESGVPCVSVHEETGLTVPPGDAAALSAALSRLLQDGELRARLGERARRRVRERFTVQQMGERTLRLYHAVTWAG